MRNASAAIVVLILSMNEVSPARGATPAEEHLTRFRALFESVPAEVSTIQAICTETLDAGATEGIWTEEERQFAGDQIKSIFEAPSANPYRTTQSAVRPPFPDEIISRGLRPFDQSTPTATVANWLAARFRALADLRMNAQLSFCTAAVERAEEIWLTAKNPADLMPARTILTEARAILSARFDSVARARQPLKSYGGYRPDFPARDPAAELVDAWSMIAAPNPLSLTDPEDDPSGFLGLRYIWAMLRNIRHRFSARPAITQRFAELDLRFERAREAADRALDDAILGDRPSVEFERALQHAALFRIPKLPPPRRSDSLARPDPMAANIPVDYVEWIAEPLGKLHVRFVQGSFFEKPIPTREDPPPVPRCYDQWLRLRKAEESNTLESVQQARRDLDSSLAELRSEVATHVAARIATAKPEALRHELPPPNPGGSDLARLIAGLEAPVAGNVAKSSDEAGLVLAWRQLPHPGEFLDTGRQESFSSRWGEFARDMGRNHLLALRERAARELIAPELDADALSQFAQAPLLTAIREGIENAIAQGAVDRAGRLLAIDSAACFLPPDEHARSAREIALLREGSQLAKDRRFADARITYRQLLHNTASSAIGSLAARELKSLPPFVLDKVPER